MFTWRGDTSGAEGRTSIWLHPEADLSFRFVGSRPPSINRTWLAQLTALANSGSGLWITPEPSEIAQAAVEPDDL